MNINWLDLLVGVLVGGTLSGWITRLWIFPLWREQADERDQADWERDRHVH